MPLTLIKSASMPPFFLAITNELKKKLKWPQFWLRSTDYKGDHVRIALEQDILAELGLSSKAKEKG